MWSAGRYHWRFSDTSPQRPWHLRLLRDWVWVRRCQDGVQACRDEPFPVISICCIICCDKLEPLQTVLEHIPSSLVGLGARRWEIFLGFSHLVLLFRKLKMISIFNHFNGGWGPALCYPSGESQIVPLERRKLDKQVHINKSLYQ